LTIERERIILAEIDAVIKSKGRAHTHSDTLWHINQVACHGKRVEKE
jgi:hypothetical protein